MVYLSMVLEVVLAVLLCVAAVSDIRTRKISNRLNLAIAVLALPYWFSLGLAIWPDMAIYFGSAFAVFAGGFVLYMVKLLGAGDVKLVGALALWCPPLMISSLLVLIAIAGGLLTIVIYGHHKLVKSEKPTVPYGVAIAIAGLWVVGWPYISNI